MNQSKNRKAGGYCLEACVDSVESAILAEKGGADRLELCSNLVIGGTTPGVGLFRQVREACALPIHVLLRPRYGDFLYTDAEFRALLEDGRMFCELGADGLVAGCLRADGSLDAGRMEMLRRAAGEGHLTLHRAFDMCRNPYEALEEAVRIGVDTILTSGQANSCLAGKELLGGLARLAEGRLNILAGGGVDEEAIRCLGKEAGITQFHLSGKRKLDSGMAYRRQGVSMGIAGIGEYEQLQTDQDKIRRAAIALREQAVMEALPGAARDSFCGAGRCSFRKAAHGGAECRGFRLSKELETFAEEMFCQVLPLLGGRREEVLQGLGRCSEEEGVLIRFLYGTMPLSDAGDYSFELFLGFARHALMLARTMEWCRGLPEELFLHGILYPRINTERLEDCRGFFYSQLIDRVKGLSVREAALEINYWCAEKAAYESTDARTASPMAVYRSGKGRCGEESVFAVTAFRSVGIPARQVYVPRWAHCDDNHAWVEVNVDGKWEFLGACEPEEALGRGWFTNASSRALIVHTGTFRGQKSLGSGSCADGHGKIEYCGTAGRMVYENLTAGYARTVDYEFWAVDEDGQPVPEAALSVEALNMAEYSRIALLRTDAEGRARLRAGIGDVLVHARKDGCWCERLCSLREDGRAVLVLKKGSASQTAAEREKGSSGQADDGWEDTDIKAPADGPVPGTVLTKEQKEKGKTRRKACAWLREERQRGYYKEALAKEHPAEEDILREAAGNFDEIYGFLSRDQNPDRAAMLHTLARKDYRDAKREILESHLEGAAKFRREWEEKGLLAVYVQWILCPRVSLEELTAYRQEIEAYFSREEKERFQDNPAKIWEYIEGRASYQPELDYPALCATPCGMLRLWWGNPMSRKVLFVAICRTLGIPSRLNPIDKEAEFYREGIFIPVSKAMKEEPGKAGTRGKGTVALTVENGEAWSYGQNWSIARLADDGYATLDYAGVRFQENELSLALDAGFYRLLTTSRLPNGDQRASAYRFWLEQGGRKEISMRLRAGGQEDMQVDYALEDFQITETDGPFKPVLASSLLDGKGNLLAFLETGQEPTEHVLNEMLEEKEMLNRLAGADAQNPIRILLVLPSREALENNTLQRVLAEIPAARTAIGAFDELAEPLARRIYVEPDRLPLLMALRPGLRVIYGCSGYHVGSVALAKNLLGESI